MSEAERALIISFALITAILTMAFALFGRPASGGEIVGDVHSWNQYSSVEPIARSLQ